MGRIIIEDTRNQVGKHRNINAQLAEMGYEVLRKGLTVGDYTWPADQSVCVDTKSGLLELCSDVIQQHERFRNEMLLAKKIGVHLIILVEQGQGIKELGDIVRWQNPRLRTSPTATTGIRLFAILHTIKLRYDVRFEFCEKWETGKRIIKLLNGG